jgi:hypothetical protein
MSSIAREPQASAQPVGVVAGEPVRAPFDAPLPRRSFFTGRVLDPELHPPLRSRLARALRSN